MIDDENLSDSHEDDDHDDHGGGAHAGGGHEEGGGHGEPWLVSYADLMTLLFGFFVIMYTFASAKSQGDDASLIAMKKELTHFFGGKYVNPFDKIEEKVLQQLAANPNIAKEIKVTSEADGIKLSIGSQMLFNSGSAELGPEAKKVLVQLCGYLKTPENPLTIKVSGHTDDAPISTTQFPSNWELSAARASAVVRVFQDEGFSEEHLMAVGYGSSRPEFPHRDADGRPIAENRILNRRVVISAVIANQKTEATQVPPPAAEKDPHGG